MTDRFRCSVAAGAEPMAGSAAHDVAFLLVEHPGPWGRKALAESRLPDHVRSGLAEAANAAGVRVQLIRRHHRSAPRSDFHVFASYADPRRPWTEAGTLHSAEQLLDLDLTALGAGRTTGLDRHEEPLVLVCTNGRRDACCAELGRPLVAALAESHPELTWETTHLGGHRFAGMLLLLPFGLSYGRVAASEGAQVVRAMLRGELVLDRLRGRTAYPGPVQAAEITLLERLGLAAVDALMLEAVEARGEVTSVRFRKGADVHHLVVTGLRGPAARQSCADVVTKPTTTYLVAPTIDP